MQDHGLRGALGVQHAQHVGVRVPVVDDQRLAVPLGDRDVRPEAGLLRRPALVAGAEGVQPGLADPAHPSAARPAPRSRAAPRPDRRSRGASLGCSATVASTAVVAGRPARRPSATTPRRHRPGPAGPRRPSRPRRSGPRPIEPPAGPRPRLGDRDVQVGVAVEHRHGQRLGRWRELSGAPGRRAACGTRSAAARCSSPSSITHRPDATHHAPRPRRAARPGPGPVVASVRPGPNTGSRRRSSLPSRARSALARCDSAMPADAVWVASATPRAVARDVRGAGRRLGDAAAHLAGGRGLLLDGAGDRGLEVVDLAR